MTPTATLRRSHFAQWLRRSQRGIAALLLGLLTLGCAASVTDEACCGWLGPASAAHVRSGGTFVPRGVDQSTPASDRHDDTPAPSSREQPAAPRGVATSACACASAVPVSAPDLVSTPVADSSSAPRGDDSPLPPSPVLELPLRPPLARLG